jgi:cytochrome c oxidase assembly protein subunit 11
LKAGEKATYVMTFYLDPELVNDPTKKSTRCNHVVYFFLDRLL